MINVANIVYDSVVDGEGLRTALFVQGCKHACPGCHNAAIQGVGGYMASIDELALTLSRNNDKLTLSGGEPMLQAKKLADMLCRIQYIGAKKMNVWCYTGFTWEEIMQDEDMLRLATLCNVIVDGKFDINLKEPGLRFRGSSNQRLIDVSKTLKEGKIIEI